MNIFCCHSSSDKDIVAPIADTLTGKNHTVFYDEWSLMPGDSLVEKIPEAISQSGVFVLFLSKAALNSNWCKRELSIAVSQMIKSSTMRIIAFRIEAIDPPLIIDDLVYIDAVTLGYEHALKRLKDTADGKNLQPDIESYQDIEVIPLDITLNGPQPAEYFAGVQIRAKRFSHPKLYVRIVATAPIHEKFCIEQGNFAGIRTTIATAIHGQTLEHTEGPPGLEPSNPWSICIFSEQSIAIADVKVLEECLFNEVVGRS